MHLQTKPKHSYGVSRWLRNDPDSRDAIMMRFKINE